MEQKVFEIVGVNESQGVYEGSPYHNVNFHTATAFADGKGVGVNVSRKKVKVAMLAAVFGKPTTISDAEGMVGKLVNFYYDEYGTVILIREVEG
jgi:hypothetical protein